MKLITSFYYTFATKLFSLLLLLISRILTARILGPADLGSLGNALNFITIISRWGTLGIGPATQFAASKYPQQKNTLFIYVILSSVLLGALNLLIVECFKSELLSWQFQSDTNGQSAFLQFIPWLPIIILSMTLPIVLLGSGQITKYSLTQTLPVLFQTITISIAYYYPASLKLVVLAQLVYWVSTAVIASFLIDYKNFHFQFDRNLLFIYIKYALKSWPQVALQFGIARFAILVGSQYLTNENLGYYILASNLSESFLIINTSVTPLIFNRIASGGADSSLLARSLRFSNFALLLVFVIIILIGRPIFLIFFGIEFSQTWNLLLLLLISVFFHGMIRICLNYLAALGKNTLATVIQSFELSVLFISGMFFCPVFGVLGLCFSSICAAVAGFLFCNAALNKVEKSFHISSILIPDKEDINMLFKIFKSSNKY